MTLLRRVLLPSAGALVSGYELEEVRVRAQAGLEHAGVGGKW